MRVRTYVSQSIFYFMSVHIEVILDNNTHKMCVCVEGYVSMGVLLYMSNAIVFLDRTCIINILYY